MFYDIIRIKIIYYFIVVGFNVGGRTLKSQFSVRGLVGVGQNIEDLRVEQTLEAFLIHM